MLHQYPLIEDYLFLLILYHLQIDLQLAEMIANDHNVY